MIEYDKKFIFDPLQVSLYNYWETSTTNDDNDVSGVVDFFWHQYLLFILDLFHQKNHPRKHTYEYKHTTIYL